MNVLLEKITEEELDTLRNLIEFAAYDLSELNGSKIDEKGSYISNLNHRVWMDDPNYWNTPAQNPALLPLYFIRYK